MKIMIPVRVEPKLKKFLEKLADKERRSLNNFLVNAALTYIKEHHSLEYEEKPSKPKK
jgi:uncharacterized protein (DUF1778 family)